MEQLGDKLALLWDPEGCHDFVIELLCWARIVTLLRQGSKALEKAILKCRTTVKL